MTTTPDLAALVQAVGGDAVEVYSIVRGVQDPHYIEAKPSYMRRVNRANLLVAVGLQLEVTWLPLLVNGARNPALVPRSPGYLDASQDIRALEVPTGRIDRSQGDIHPEGDPHYWLDPRNGLRIAERSPSGCRLSVSKGHRSLPGQPGHLSESPGDSDNRLGAADVTFRRHIASLINKIKTREVPVLLCADFTPPKIP